MVAGRSLRWLQEQEGQTFTPALDSFIGRDYCRARQMIVIRRPTLDDAAGTARVHALSWKSAYRGIVPDEFLDAIDVEEWAERHRRSMVEDPEDFVSYLAEVDGEIVGWALGGPNRDPALDYAAELFTLYLLPNYTRQGIGRRLMRAVAESLVESGFGSMVLLVLADNWPARRFYESLGGRCVSEKEHPIGGVSLMEVAYGWKDLRWLLKAAG